MREKFIKHKKSKILGYTMYFVLVAVVFSLVLFGTGRLTGLLTNQVQINELNFEKGKLIQKVEDLEVRLHSGQGSSSAGISVVSKSTTESALARPVNDMGFRLMQGSDCMICHQPDKKMVGPSFKMIAEKYGYTQENVDLLSGKIKKGGLGVWGQFPMSAHPDLETDKVSEMVKWILNGNQELNSSQNNVESGKDNAPVLRVKFLDSDEKVFLEPKSIIPNIGSLEFQKIELYPQNITTPSKSELSVSDIQVLAVHNGQWIAFIAKWKDEVKNELNLKGIFSDAFAIGLPVNDPLNTSPFMGEKGKLMEIIYWKALWQRDVEKGYLEISEIYPNITADEYMGYNSDALPNSNPASRASMKEVTSGPGAKNSLPALAVSNPVTQLDRKFPVEQLIAEGFGTLTTQSIQDARGYGVYQNGEWMVVMTRPLNTQDETDRVLTLEENHSVNFAVWDGEKGDVGAKKNYAPLVALEFEKRE